MKTKEAYAEFKKYYCSQLVAIKASTLKVKEKAGERRLNEMKVKIIFFIVIFLLGITKMSFALVITTPKSGATFKEADTVKIVAEKSPDDASIAFVRFTAGIDICPERISTHPSYKCSFVIPAGSPRVIEIGAIAVTANEPIFAPRITIHVSLPSSVILQGLKSFTGNTIYFFQLGQNKKLDIEGSYSDGVERDLRLGQTGTTYISSNEKVATVNADGLATAVGPGNAKITVRNGDKKLVIDVVVQPKR